MSDHADRTDHDLLSSLEAIRHFDRAKEPIETLVTPFASLNSECRDDGGGEGLALGWYAVIGGDTGQGKSLLALQLAAEAVRQGHRPGFVSMEMGIRQLRTRFLAMLTGVPAWKIEPGPNHNRHAAKDVVAWLDEFRSERGYHPFHASDASLDHYRKVLDLMEAWRVDGGVRVFVIDYLQLCEAPEEAGVAQEVKRISKAMRDYAHETGCLVIALSQYNNESGNDRARKPHAGSLYGGRRISQDSDVTLCIDHSRYERIEDEHKARTWLLTVKNRHGGYPEIPIEWEYNTLKAREADPDEEHQWPE